MLQRSALLFLGLALACLGMKSAELPSDLVAVKSVTLKAASGPSILAEVELVNKSSQTITAYTTTVTVQFSNGQTMSQSMTTDVVYLLAMDRIGAEHPTEKRFDPGAVAIERLSLSADPASIGGARATAKVAMVALADGSASGDVNYILRLQEARLREAVLMDDVVGVLAELRKASDPRSALESSLAQRRAALPSEPAQRRRGEQQIRRLETILGPVVGEGNSIDSVWKLYSVRRDVCREQAVLKNLNDPEERGATTK